ncbi:hypothetical protein [Brevibacillus formosus]|uniref:hypothetical protein n=1 Tax=Brevibacillus formosus TaxID=54913 RepID=UPI003F1B8CB8
MNTAQHSTTNEIYSANQVEKMDSLTQNSLRKHLQCEECKAKAFFRNKSRNGRTACFFAEHKAGCSLGNTKKSDGESTEKKQDHMRESDSDIFGIRWNDLFQLVTNETKSDLIEAFNKKGKSHTEYTKNPAKMTTSNLTLAKILHYAKNKILAKQEFKIILNDKTERLQDIVFHTHYLKEFHTGKVGLYWGYLNSTDNINWLNIDKSSPFNRFSIQLHQDM